jgi:hypothetical protein
MSRNRWPGRVVRWRALRRNSLHERGKSGFETDDAQFHLELYRNADPEDSFDHFEEQREINIEFLRGLPKGAGARRAVHQKVGPITLEQMLNEWAMHTIWVTFGRSPNWCGRASTWRERAHSAAFIN